MYKLISRSYARGISIPKLEIPSSDRARRASVGSAMTGRQSVFDRLSKPKYPKPDLEPQHDHRGSEPWCGVVKPDGGKQSGAVTSRKMHVREKDALKSRAKESEGGIRARLARAATLGPSSLCKIERPVPKSSVVDSDISELEAVSTSLQDKMVRLTCQLSDAEAEAAVKNSAAFASHEIASFNEVMRWLLDRKTIIDLTWFREFIENCERNCLFAARWVQAVAVNAMVTQASQDALFDPQETPWLVIRDRLVVGQIFDVEVPVRVDLQREICAWMREQFIAPVLAQPMLTSYFEIVSSAMYSFSDVVLWVRGFIDNTMALSWQWHMPSYSAADVKPKCDPDILFMTSSWDRYLARFSDKGEVDSQNQVVCTPHPLTFFIFDVLLFYGPEKIKALFVPYQFKFNSQVFVDINAFYLRNRTHIRGLETRPSSKRFLEVTVKLCLIEGRQTAVEEPLKDKLEKEDGPKFGETDAWLVSAVFVTDQMVSLAPPADTSFDSLDEADPE